MTYQILSNHSKQYFRDIKEIKSRYSEVNKAMQDLIRDINKITQAHLSSSPLPNPAITLLEIRTGSQNQKSYYECIVNAGINLTH